MKWDDYFWPGTEVLKNRLGITDDAALELMERELVAQQLRAGAPQGDFDLDHLRAIHHHLFQDVYPWAGELRRVTMNKGGPDFMPHDRLEMGMADVHRRLEAQDRLQGRDQASFAAAAGIIIGDINHLHPFREGNGRTQLEYLRQLASQAGHDFDARQLNPQRWIEASIAASDQADYAPMAAEIERALHSERERARVREIEQELAAARARPPRDRER